MNEQDPIARIERAVAESGNRFVTTPEWRKNAGDTDNADIYLGSLVVSEPELSDAGQIVLVEAYRSHITTDSRCEAVPLTGNILLGERQIRATKDTVAL